MFSTALYRAFNDTVIRELAQNHIGRYKEAVDLVPHVFDLYVRLLEEPSFPEQGRLFVNASIAYFVSPFVGSKGNEQHSAGLLDDLFLCAWVLGKLEELVGYEFLEDKWEGNGSLSEALVELDQKSAEYVGALEEEVLLYFKEWLSHCVLESATGDGMDIVDRLLYLI